MGFFTLLSMRPRGRNFFTAYAVWTFGVQMVGTLIILLLVPASLLSKAWEGESRGLIILAFVAVFASTQAWNSVLQLGEAQRRTFVVQVASAAQALAHLILLTVAAITGHFNVAVVLVFLIVEFAILIGVIAPPLLRSALANSQDNEHWGEVARSLVHYCRPVAVYSYAGFIYSFADRWLLQHFGGAVQQGLFGFAQQFGSISILVTAAMMNIFWKEIAEASALGNLDRVRDLYMRSRRALFFTAAWTSCLLIPWSGWLLVSVAGSQYAAGASVLALMLLYPVHQSLGQLQGTFFIATGETRLYSSLGLVSMGVSVIVTYFLLATPSARIPGLGLGAMGLAAKLVGLQLIQVLLFGIVIARRYRWPYDLRHQFELLGGLLLISFAIRWLVKFGELALGSTATAVVALLLYLAATSCFIWKYPEQAGFSRELVLSVAHRIRLRIRTGHPPASS